MVNCVLEGEYKNYKIRRGSDCPWIDVDNKIINLNKGNIDTYDVITEEKVKSGTSAILRGLVGTAIFGPIGAIAGYSAKTKGTYLIAVLFKNGKKSLLQINDIIYKEFVRAMF